MRVCVASLYHAPAVTGSPAAYLDRFPFLRHLPQALARQGLEVHVVQHHPAAAAFREGEVRYYFEPAGAWSGAAARVAARLAGRSAARTAVATAAVGRIVALQPDVVHFHGFLTLNLLALQRAFGGAAPPIVAHYHGGYPSRHPLWRPLQARALRPLARALFTTRAHADHFLATGLLRPEQVEEMVEVSSPFQRMDRDAASARTDMVGEPVFLSTARLHPDKDPLTMLRGFDRIAGRWPGARLYLHYLTDELLPECRKYVASRPHLADRVFFRGRAAPPDMEAIYNSADFLLQASQGELYGADFLFRAGRRELSGYAVLEAMSCGVIPVVSDIPSFRAMTQAGRYGLLFPPGDDAALARLVLEVDLQAIPDLAAAVRRHFEAALSYDAMASSLRALYAALPGG